MQFSCPSCQATIAGNFAKPGKFQPKCPKCGKLIQITIQVSLPESGTSAAPEPRKPEAESPKTAPTPKPPAPAPRPKAVPKFLTPKSARPPDPEATFATQPEPEEKEESPTEELARMVREEVDPEATFATQNPEPGPSEHEGEETEATAHFERPQASASHDHEDTEATGGYLPKPDSAEEVDRTAAITNPAAEADAESTTDLGTQVKATPKPAAPKKPAPKKKPAKKVEDEMPDQLGGYEILKQLGKGGMGAVYLARQMSLDRPVALKVMNAQIAADARFVARFVREAYAAAQLTHHNIVQIYDIGTEEDVNFFSMEFVRGGSLGDVLKKNGKVPAAEAVGDILQAARGLKFAHDRGMVHRDIKPDNLMLNTDGIVKAADMGLIKTRDMKVEDDETGDGPETTSGSLLKSQPDITNAGAAMGSPSYMAPEQCRDASTVDGRADIYSLGCTLFALLSGRTPFQGKTAVEVITKQINEPPPPLQTVTKEVPKQLADIVNRTLLKEPSKRYQSMDELIDALKHWQEKSAAGPPRATEEQITLFDGLTKKMGQNTKTKLAAKIGLFGPLLGLVVALLCFFVVSPSSGGGVLIGTGAVVLSGLITSGLITNSFLFSKVRSWIFGARFFDWFMIGLAVVMFLVVIGLAGMFGTALIALLVGTGVGVGFAYGFAKPAATARADQKDDLEGVVKRLRLQGMEEDAVRKFVVTTSGDKWEEVYETLFGYEDKVKARVQFAEETMNRPKFGGWRDGLIQRIDAILDARQKAKAQKLLQKVEAARLQAEGVSEAEAKAKARDAAEDIVEAGAEIKAANADAKKKVNVRQMMSRYDKAKADRPPRKRKNPVGVLFKKMLDLPFDPKLRFLVGAFLLVAGLLWIRQEAAAFPVKPGTAAPSLIEKIEPAIQAGEGKPLKLSWLPFDMPTSVMSFFNCPNAILAGLLLVVSVMNGRSFAVLGVMLGAFIAFAGHHLGLPLPDDLYGFKPSHMMASLGVTLALFCMIMLGSQGGRGRDVPDEAGE